MVLSQPQVWNTTIKSSFLTRNHNAINAISNALNDMQTEIAAIAAGTSDAQSRYDSKKPIIENKLSTLQTLNTELQEKVRALDTTQIQYQIASKKDEMADLKSTRDEKQTLVNLRTEQTTELAQKYGSNYHSSWLGLWRPLAIQ